MVIFEEAGLRAPSVWAVEGALSVVTFPHGSLDRGRNVTRLLFHFTSRARMRGLANLGALELLEQ